jgi:protein involved in polysaccharide export with SLBB domain
MNRLSFPALVIAAGIVLAGPVSAQIAKIRPGDGVTLSIRGVPDKEAQMISGVYKVDQNGILVGLPYLEDRRIHAGGLTEGELSRNIAQAYRDADIYKKATFTAIVDQPKVLSSRRVTVGGEAVRPGPVEYNEGMNAFDAFTAAGGADRFGTSRRVFLLRDGTKRTLDMSNDRDKMVPLLPGDTLDVDKAGAFELKR